MSDRTSTLRVQARLLGKDLRESLQLWRFWGHLGWADILKQYRRSILGPLWVPISMTMFIVLFGMIGAQLFKLPVENYLPYFCAGLIGFNFLAAMISEGCQTFIAAEAFLKQTPYPKSAFVLRVVWRNLLMFLHNLPVVAGVLFWAGKAAQVQFVWLAAGTAVCLLAGVFVVAILGAVSARYRDVPMLVSSVMQIAFFATPVMWDADQLTQRARDILVFNPLAAFLDLIRAPLLGTAPNGTSLAVTVGTLALLACSWVAIYLAARRRIVYWV